MDGNTGSRTRRGFLAAVGAAGLAGCGRLAERETTAEYELNHTAEAWSRYDSEWDSPTDSPLSVEIEPEVLVENLEIPWDLAFAPTGELFVTERTGHVQRFDGEGLETVATPDSVIDAEAMAPGPDDDPFWETWFVEGGEGGMLGVAVHPKYPDAPYVYVYFTAEADGGKVNRVVRYDVDAEDTAGTGEVIVDAIPAGGVHNGGRIAFGPENYLWVTTGDSGQGKLAQDTASLAGSVLRVDAAGDPAPGNPDLPGEDPDDRIYTYGHRNPQCITWLPDATPIVTEHGPDGHDEVNLLEAGANYGWPEARKRAEYEADSQFHRPVVNTPESWAPSGGVFYTGDEIPEWRNRLVFGSLFGQRVNVVTLAEETAALPPVEDENQGESRGMRFDAGWLDGDYAATAHRTLTDVLGRVRHVEQGPDGHLYAVTSNRDGRPKGETFPRQRDDVLVRLKPSGE